MLNKSVAILLTLLMVPFFILLSGTTPSRADLLSSIQSDIQSLTGQYQSLQQNQAQTQAKINYLQSQADTLQNQLSTLDRQITTTNTGISQRQVQVAQMNKSITALSAQITSNETKQAQDQDKFNKILVGVYEDGPVSYLQVILGANSFSDFLTRMNYMGTILSFDRNILTQLFFDHQTLASEKQSLDQARQTQVNTLASLSQLKQQQKDQSGQKSGLLSQVQSAKKAEQADLNSENHAMQYISSQIKTLQEKYGNKASTQAPAGAWLWPVPGHYTITSGYGWRTIFGGREFHGGIDIGAPTGTPIIASNNGVVLYAGPAEGFGQWIVMQHSDGLMSLYGDMYANGVWVHPGEVVKAGQEIGAVGANGDSTGPHLHFGIITGFDSAGYPVTLDPTQYVSP
ncbi:MAG TPA: peptidoglycan DD-metalloendopeptidase family protein [Spirochaetia bacterium]|nr:peptidoglycan DD-metalloendopeptidase family protein [Spirochaetia bacterium]